MRNSYNRGTGSAEGRRNGNQGTNRVRKEGSPLGRDGRPVGRDGRVESVRIPHNTVNTGSYGNQVSSPHNDNPIRVSPVRNGEGKQGYANGMGNPHVNKGNYSANGGSVGRDVVDNNQLYSNSVKNIPQNFADEYIKEDESFPAMEENTPRDGVVQAFIKLANEIDNRYNKPTLYDNANNFDVDGSDPQYADGYSEYDENGAEKKKKKFPTWGKVLIIVGSVLLTISMVVAGFFIFKSAGNANGKQETTVSVSEKQGKVQEMLNKLYTDETKTEIKDGYSVKDLDDAKEAIKGLDVGSAAELNKEVKTIEMYLTDSKKVVTYSDLSYNIEPDYIASDLRQASLNTEGYSVPGLKATMSNRINAILTDRDSYLSIKSELNAIKDPLKFNAESYRARINGINHTFNKAELVSLSESLSAKKSLAEAEKAVKDAADKKAKEEAEKALAAAQSKQKEMESKLAEAKKALENAVKPAEPTKSDENNEVKQQESDTEADSDEDNDIAPEDGGQDDGYD